MSQVPESCDASTAGAFEGAEPIPHEPQEPPFFTNRACPYFPCHEGVPDEQFNCIFCFCPLYALGDACPGTFVYLENGVKDCSQCSLPHRGHTGDRLVLKMFPRIAEIASQNRRRDE